METFISQITPWQLSLVALAGAAFIGLIIWSIGRPSFRRRDLMTANETEFFHRLTGALPAYNIWPQVPIFALLEPKGTRQKGHLPSSFRQISNRRVDWVIARGPIPVIVIELDDKTHNVRADKRRDKILSSCGYPVLRYESKSRPTQQTIANDVQALIATLPVHRI